MMPFRGVVHIIGQGLAGSLLAAELLSRGFRVKISDDGHQSSSSMVAAGMWNPVTFKKLSESWMASSLLIEADEMYTRLSRSLELEFYHQVELARIFPNHHAANEWDEKSVHPELSPYLTDHRDQTVQMEFNNSFGHGIVQGAGWLNIPMLLNALKFYFQSKDCFSEGLIDESLLDPSPDEIFIHCTGWRMVNSQLFDWAPVIPNKGEVLTVLLPQLSMERMVNFGNFIVPVGDHVFRLGATYKLNEPDPNPLPETALNMLSELKEVYPHTSQLLDHKAGYRPTTPDRRPLLGEHPAKPGHFIFNGFGSKGVLLIPFFAKHFADVLEGKANWMSEVDIRRYWNKPIGSHASLVSCFRS